MGTYTWATGTYRNAGGAFSSAPGYGGVDFSPGSVGAPSSTSKLARVGLSMLFHGAGLLSNASISPDWAWMQTGYVCAAVQAAGDLTVPSPTDPAPVGHKLTAKLDGSALSFAPPSTVGYFYLQTAGMLWSQGEDRTPPGGGLQVRVGWGINDGTGTAPIFGTNFRWAYDVQLRVLWFTP